MMLSTESWLGPFGASVFYLLFFFTLATSLRRSLILKLSDTRVYEPHIRAPSVRQQARQLGGVRRVLGLHRSRWFLPSTPEPCTLHPAPCTLHPALSTLHPKPCTPNFHRIACLHRVPVSHRSFLTRNTLLSFFTLLKGPRRSLSLELSDAKVYEPQIRAVSEPLPCSVKRMSLNALASSAPAASLPPIPIVPPTDTSSQSGSFSPC